MEDQETIRALSRARHEATGQHSIYGRAFDGLPHSRTQRLDRESARIIRALGAAGYTVHKETTT